MPRQRQVTQTLYKFAELSEEAKEKAKIDYASAFGFDWGDEYLASLKALAEHFGGKLADYQIDWFKYHPHSSARFDMPELDAEEIRSKLAELGSYNPETLKGNGDCKLTGFCGDEGAIDGLRIAFLRDGETDLDKLMQAAFDSWLKEAQADCESQYSDEQFGETSNANEREYFENGELA